MNVNPEDVYFRFSHKKHHLAVIFQFEEPTGGGQFGRVRLTVGSESMIVRFKPGRFKPRVADCKELAGYCLEKNGQLRSVAEAVSLLCGNDRPGFVRPDNSGAKTKHAVSDLKRSQRAIGIRFERQDLN